MSFIIATDSTTDLPEQFFIENDIKCFYLTSTIQGKDYGEEEKLDMDKFYELMRAGEPTKTSQINPEDAKEKFLELLKKGNDILYIAFSSGLSGTYNSARIAAEEVKEEYPDSNIRVVDTKAASMGEGLMVYYAVKLRTEGKSIDEVEKWLNDHALNFVHIFTVDDLNFLYRGGRVSRSTAFVGTMLSIKPILHVDDEGHLIPIGKTRGRKKSLIELVDRMEEKIGSYRDNNSIFFISHGDCLEDALFVRDEVINRFHIAENMINLIGPVVGAHSGPGTVALFFMGDER